MQPTIMEYLTHWRGEFVLDNDPDSIPPVIAILKENSAILGLPRQDVEGLGIAIEEALVNSVQHGNLEVSSGLRQGNGDAFHEMIRQRCGEPPYCDRRVWLRADFCRQEAVFRIRDEGRGFSLTEVQDPRDPCNLERIGGRGILLMREYMDEVQYNQTGNEVRMVKRRPTDR